MSLHRCQRCGSADMARITASGQVQVEHSNQARTLGPDYEKPIPWSRWTETYISLHFCCACGQLEGEYPFNPFKLKAEPGYTPPPIGPPMHFQQYIGTTVACSCGKQGCRRYLQNRRHRAPEEKKA